MSDDRIERDTLIAAPVERVWSLVAVPGFWVANVATVTGDEAKPGQAAVASHPEFGEFPVRVEKVEPPTYVAYRWASAFPGDEVREDNSTLVEFTLTREGDMTRLRVVESGFAALTAPDDVRGQAMNNNTSGWSQVFDAVRERLEPAVG